MRFAEYIYYSVLIFVFYPCISNAMTVAEHQVQIAATLSTIDLTRSDDNNAISTTRKIVDEVVRESYPELLNVKIEIRSFKSQSDFFRSQFSVSRFLTFRRLKYYILVNPRVFDLNVPPEGLRAIIAHELAHIRYYLFHDRYELLGLVRLLSRSFTTSFERKADLEAIKRGYEAGLAEYRSWLYQNIPPPSIRWKKRYYFSPEEMEMIVNMLRKDPSLVDCWFKKVPRNLAEIEDISAICQLTPTTAK